VLYTIPKHTALCVAAIFNCYTFYGYAAKPFGTFAIPLRYIAKEPSQYTSTAKKDSHSNHHHHSFIAVQKWTEAYLNIKWHYVIFWRSLSRMQGNQKIT